MSFYQLNRPSKYLLSMKYTIIESLCHTVICLEAGTLHKQNQFCKTFYEAVYFHHTCDH